MAQWIERWPVNQKIATSILSQGTCLGRGPGSQLGVCKRQLTDVSLDIHVSLPLLLSLKINK